MLRIGIIGSGGRGAYLASLVQSSATAATVVATCDSRPQQLAQDREVFGSIYTTSSYEDLLRQELDAVFVTTPDFLHEEMAVAALRACPAVYLEKPMAITIEGCDRILETAQANGSRLYLGHNMRHMPFVLKMKELIDAGAIGEVKAVWCRHFVGNGGDYYFKDWHAEQKNSTSLLLQKGSHDIDIIHWLAGGYSRLVTAIGGLTVYDQVTDRQQAPAVNQGISETNWPPLAQTKLNPVIDVEDLSMVLMNLDNGVHASYQQCHYTPDYWRNYTVIGTEGRIENFGDHGAGTHIKLWNQRHLNYHGEADATFDIAPGSGGHGGSDQRIVSEFLRFASQGGATNTSPLAARNSVAAGVAAANSLRNGSIPILIPQLSVPVIKYFENQQITPGVVAAV